MLFENEAYQYKKEDYQYKNGAMLFSFTSMLLYNNYYAFRFYFYAI